MKIYSVFDPEFKPYGQVVQGMDTAIVEILEEKPWRNPRLLIHVKTHEKLTTSDSTPQHCDSLTHILCKPSNIVLKA